MKGLITKKNAGLFEVDYGERVQNLKALGNVKKQGLYVGDYVEADEVITKIYPRKNILIRPPLANLDRLFIVIASAPKPDLVLVDKLIIYAVIKGIEPLIVVNKTDLGQELASQIKQIYSPHYKIILTSALENASELRAEIKGLCAFCGQSAVGKSSLINALLGEHVTEVGDLSKKVERGKQTTRMTRLYKFENGYLADTAGFSLLDAALTLPVGKAELGKYYPDFLAFIEKCKFRTCTHENGKDCGVIKAVKDVQISLTRYQNYLKILEEIKEKR